MISKLGVLLKWLVLLPLLLAALLLAVANDQTVTVHLNPFQVDDPVLRVDLALYQLGFILFALGALAGALVSWKGHLKSRGRARHRVEEAEFRQREARRSERQDHRVPSAATAFLPRPERG